jgi:hypothetical protein
MGSRDILHLSDVVIGGEGASHRYSPAAKYLYWSINKKSRHLRFGIFLDI